MARRVTLQDVAAKCGVSPSTVSLVYNNHPLSQRLAGETVEKVQRAILELGYHPTAAAKNLATGITGKIALSIPLSDTLSQKEPWLLEVMGGFCPCWRSIATIFSSLSSMIRILNLPTQGLPALKG